jgi:hypothetical protein
LNHSWKRIQRLARFHVGFGGPLGLGLGFSAVATAFSDNSFSEGESGEAGEPVTASRGNALLGSDKSTFEKTFSSSLSFCMSDGDAARVEHDVDPDGSLRERSPGEGVGASVFKDDGEDGVDGVEASEGGVRGRRSDGKTSSSVPCSGSRG